MAKNMFGNKRNLLVIIAIFVGVTIYFIVKKGSPNPYSFSVADDMISLTGGNDYAYSVAFDDIDSIELEQNLDIGECIEGASNRSHICGIYENDRFGRYDLWVIKKVNSYIIITDKADHVLVINFEDARSTNELYKAILEYIK